MLELSGGEQMQKGGTNLLYDGIKYLEKKKKRERSRGR